MTDIAPPSRSFTRRLSGFVLRMFFLFGIPVLAALAGLHYYASTGRYITTENAYIKARKTAISSNIAGRVVKVHVLENGAVKAGDVLLELSSLALNVQLKEALADLQVVKLEIRKQRAALKRARVERGGAKEDLRYAGVELTRQQKLASTGAGRSANLDSALHDVEAARQKTHQVEADVAELISGLGGREDIPDQQMPAWQQAQAAIDHVMLLKSWTRIIAPSDGVVVKATVQPGEFVDKGQAIFVLVDQEHVWLEANLKETQLERLVLGMPAKFTLDAWPDYFWQAMVQSVAPATGAEFALLPPQNASGNWVKVVQRLPVRLEFKYPDDAPRLRAGMTAEVFVDTGQERKLHPGLERLITLTGGRW